ncbi:hypothetical protein B0T24DRAFT_609923 [Lasiosphaeria ovina]|uniref:NACHT domain-containing protein n=1 Tax=Lasiosphaeria ovina TaxID=92902 RepID=A0AAE0NCW4_9PEZI|nr:hypothetical protein B0T24DRAFT_644835 [Lasiosphaeria ovina]KAK3378780.1 hypothetical protein B0T24DRAFT_609923 [Lasiosphaeria ovina]
MEPLATLSVACNVMQVISFGLEAVSLCKRVYERGHPEPELVSHSSSLHELATALFHELGSCQKMAAGWKKDDKALLAIAARCADAANALKEEADFLAPRDPKQLSHVIKAAAKTVWRKRRLERLEKELSRSQGVMETYLLATICTRAEALARQDAKGFAILGSAMQDLVHRYAKGSEALSGDIREGADKVRSHVSAEARRTRLDLASASAEARHHLSQQLQQLHVDDERETRRARILSSLKYGAMNDRTNTITEKHPDTFQWIFQGDSVGSEEHDVRPTARWSHLPTWLESDEKLYWISGKPGSGKSTLVKFLVSSEDTQVELKKWRPGARILSHFFWAPGTNIQRNIKGMLCSLLYQSLWRAASPREELAIGDPTRENEDDIEDLVQRFPNLLGKDSISDWSEAELKEVIFSHLHSAGPRCIILDGLDEVSQKDGPFKLLRLIDELRAVSGVKLCVASRPEHILRSHLEKHPHLLMQDLTEPDIRKYVTTYLEKEVGVPIPSQYRHSIIDDVVRGAEGVFLWVVLVLNSLQRGLHNGDSWAELEKRLHLMPTDLSRLYSDMWSRLNDDEVIYRRTAALQLFLTLRFKENGAFAFVARKQLSVLQLTIASELSIQFDSDILPSPVELAGKCERTLRDLETRCAGLLTVSPRSRKIDLDRSDWWGPICQETSHGRLLQYLDCGVQFIHRTAYDFLMEDGGFIRRDCELDEDGLFLRLFRGWLLECQIFFSLAPWMREHNLITTLQCITSLPKPDQLLKTVVSMLKAKSIPHTVAEDVLQLTIKVYESAPLISGPPARFNRRQPAFLAIVCAYGHYELLLTQDFVMQQLLISSSERLFFLLEDLCDIDNDDNDAYSHRCWLIRNTLDQIHTKTNPPSISTCIPVDAAEAVRAAGIRFVHNAFLRHDIDGEMEEPSSKALVDSMHTIHAFICSGLHIDTTLCLRLFVVDMSTLHKKPARPMAASPRFGAIDTFFSMPPHQQPEDQSFGLTIRTDLATVVELMAHRNADLLAGLPEDLPLLPPHHGLPISPAVTASIVAVSLLEPHLVPILSYRHPKEIDVGTKFVEAIEMRPTFCVPSVATQTNAEVLVEIALGWMRSQYHQPQQEADMREARRLISLILEQSPQSETWEGLNMGFDIASFATVHWTHIWWKEPSRLNAFISRLEQSKYTTRSNYYSYYP